MSFENALKAIENRPPSHKHQNGLTGDFMLYEQCWDGFYQQGKTIKGEELTP